MFDFSAMPEPSGPMFGEAPAGRARAVAARHRRQQRGLTRAVIGGDLRLHYRPRVALATGRQSVAETALRWRDPQGGSLGGGPDLGGWVLRTACVEAAAWDRRCGISVPVSGCQLVGGTLLEQIAAALDESGLDPELLEVNLTEKALLDLSVDTLLLLSAIRDLGVGVALDRFGTGLISLAVLYRLPLTVVKLDQSLTRALSAPGQETALLRTLIAAGHALDLVVSADGVGETQQANLLHAFGCDEAQGALFGTALPAADMRARLAATEG